MDFELSSDIPNKLLSIELIEHWKEILSFYRKFKFYNEKKHQIEINPKINKWYTVYYRGKLIYSYLVNQLYSDYIFIKLNLDDPTLDINLKLFIKCIQHIIRISIYAKNILYIDNIFKTLDLYYLFMVINPDIIYIKCDYLDTTLLLLDTIEKDKYDAFKKLYKYNYTFFIKKWDKTNQSYALS